jgi:hypothetical protein
MYDTLEESGGNLYLNNTINKWLLSLFTQGASDLYYHFIWDMFLLEGNIIIFKTIYAMMIMLEDHIVKCKTFDQLNNVFNQVPLEFDERGRLAYYLISKKFNFNIEMIKKYRKSLSNQIIKEIVDLGFFESNPEEEEESEEVKQKKIICDLDWPLCSKDKKNLEKEYDHVVLRELDEPCVIENYIDNLELYKRDIKEKDSDNNKDNNLEHFKEKIFKDLLIERKKHCCGTKIMSIRSNFPNSMDLLSIKKAAARRITIKLCPNNLDEDLYSIERNKTINKMVSDIANDNKNIISFVKENVETGLLK